MRTDIARVSNRELRLPDSYVARDVPDYYDDDDDSYLIRQPDVYGLARTIALRLGRRALVDIGCGKAVKLLDIAEGFDIVGADFGENIEHCRRAHPTLQWEDIDLETVTPSWLGRLHPDSLLVCGDVIEHLCDPRPLLSLFRTAAEAGMPIVVSTPDRALIYEDGQLGPPTLGAHVREWTLHEFGQMLLDWGIPLAAIGHTRPSIGTDDASTILAVAIPGFPPPEPASPHGSELWSSTYATEERHRQVAESLGFASIEITDGALLLRGASIEPPKAGTRTPPSAPITVNSTGRGVFPFNLVAFDSPAIPAEAAAATRRHLAIAVSGSDPSSTIWADESRRWLLHREAALSAGFDEANAIRNDLRRQLEDARDASDATITDLEVQIADLRTIEQDLRRSSAAIEADLRLRLDDLAASLATAETAVETLDRERRRLAQVVEVRREQLTVEAEQRARTMPDVDRSNLAIPVPYGPRRAGPAAVRRLAPRMAAVLRRAASLPRLTRLQRAADDLASTAVPARSVPAWLFDAGYYLRTFPPAATSGVSAAAHYEMVGWRLGLSPHPLFASGWYLANHPDVRTAGIDPLRHFVEIGWALGYDPHPLFSISWYLEQGPDVAAAGMNPLVHYLQFGWQENRDPHPLFDTDHYLTARPDVAAAGVNPLAHYSEHGWRERTSPSRLFDPWYYERTTPESVMSTLPQYWYFLEVGAHCGDVTSELAAQLDDGTGASGRLTAGA